MVQPADGQGGVMRVKTLVIGAVGLAVAAAIAYGVTQGVFAYRDWSAGQYDKMVAEQERYEALSADEKLAYEVENYRWYRWREPLVDTMQRMWELERRVAELELEIAQLREGR